MHWTYGSHTSESNDSIIASHVEIVRNRAGEMMERKFRHEVAGYLKATGATDAIVQASMKTKMDNLLSNLAVQNRDFIFYLDDGTPSATHLYNVGSITGVKVVEGPSFVGTTGDERGTQCKFQFAVEASYPLAGAPRFLFFREKLTFRGGGPIYIVRGAVKGPPQRQKVAEQSPFYATQEGYLEGYLQAAAQPPPPIWPGAVLHRPEVDREGGERRGNGYSGFPLRWKYEYGATGPLVGLPHAWV